MSEIHCYFVLSVVAFQLITANRYQLTKNYRKLKRRANEDSSQVSESALKMAQVGPCICHVVCVLAIELVQVHTSALNLTVLSL